MSQTDRFHIPNLGGAPFRALLNQILAALADQNSGSNEPESPFAGMVWLDTSIEPPVFRLRNAANTGWVTIFTAENPPNKELIGLSKVPNYSATADLADGALNKFLLAAAGKELQDNKLDKNDEASDSARLGGILAQQYVLVTGSYSNLRAQATTAGDVGLGSVMNYGITSSLTSNNGKQYLSAKGGYDLNLKKVDKTTTINGHALDDNIDLTPENVGAFPANGGNLAGAINYTLTTGDIITLGGKALLRRISSGGGASFGCDDALMIGCGEARKTLEDNVSKTAEELHLGSDGAIKLYTGLQNDWAGRKEFELEADGGFKAPNAEKTRQNLDVPSTSEARRYGRVIGEIVEFGFDEAEPGFFIMNGTRVVGGMLEPAYQALRDKCLGKFIHQSGDDFIVQDMPDFRRGKGSSSRAVGSYEGDAIRNITGHFLYGRVARTAIGGAFYSGGSYGSTGNTTAGGDRSNTTYFSASRQVPTASENRPKSRTVLVCIYHGVGV